MNVGAQRPTKIPKRSPDAPVIASTSVPPCVNHTTMLPITDKNPSAYERFALKPHDLSFLNTVFSLLLGQTRPNDREAKPNSFVELCEG